ncbi:Serine/threonine-protein phosphatase 4 regulatory subunit 3-like protein [Abortiporus biennis]
MSSSVDAANNIVELQPSSPQQPQSESTTSTPTNVTASSQPSTTIVLSNSGPVFVGGELDQVAGLSSTQAGARGGIDGRSSDADKMFESTLEGASSLPSLIERESMPSADVGARMTVMLEGTINPMSLTDDGGPGPSSSPEQHHQQPGGIGDDQQWTEDDSHELKRVKVYELIGARWVDQGTAFCFGDFQDNEALLVARAEADFNQVILSTTIRSNDVYQRQQGMRSSLFSTKFNSLMDVACPLEDTLIVWTEPDGVDYALSFQDPEGCAEVWNFIQEVQRHMNAQETGLSSSPLLGESSMATASIIRTGHLPPPTLGIIGEIERAIKTITRTPQMKERVCEYIQSEEYLKGMIDVFTQAEDLESLENLHALCSCMQTILMLNDHSLYEHILEDDIFFGVVGILEYDPEFPTYKANYREFLKSNSHYHQPVPIRDPAIQKKVHHTYRLQFLKDVVLARAIDDSTFNVLNSCIIFNQIDIINHVQNDPTFLREVVGMFMDDEALIGLGLGLGPGANSSGKEVEKPKVFVKEEPVKEIMMDIDQSSSEHSKPKTPPTSDAQQHQQQHHHHLNGATGSSTLLPPPYPQPISSDASFQRRSEVILLIQQLCVMGKNVQLPARMALFRNLTDRGILFAVQWALGRGEEDTEEGRSMVSAAGEILITLLDHDLNGIRAHVVKQLALIEKEKEMAKERGKDGKETKTETGASKETILMLICRVLVRSKDLAVQSQIAEALKMLMEIPLPDAEPHPMMTAKMFQRPKDDPTTEKFMEYFYKSCVLVLFKPLFDIPEFKNKTESVIVMSRERTNLCLQLCDLLGQFSLQHSFRSHFFLLTKMISLHVASLLSAKDKYLRLAAFRFFRVLLRLNNRNIFSHMIKQDLLSPILDLTLQESRRDNLLSSSCQEFFEHMRRENVKELINHCMTKFEDKIKTLSETPLGGPRFKAFIRRWEINIEPPPKDEEKLIITNGPQSFTLAMRREAEENDYFNADDDEDEIVPVLTFSRTTPTAQGSPNPIGSLKRKRAKASGIPIRRPPIQRSPQPLGTLLDYDDEGDSGSGDDTKQPSGTLHQPTTQDVHGLVPSSPRITHRQIPYQQQQGGQGGGGANRPTTISISSSSSSEDEQDDLLESLVSKSGPPSPSTVLGSKRRRDDDDEETLERLLNKPKRQSIGSTTPGSGVTTIGGGGDRKVETVGRVGGISGKNGGEEGGGGPKKIKLKLASSTPTSNSPSNFPSSTGAKDGDTG